MSENNKFFTFIWKVKNFSFLENSRFSPSFSVPAMSKTRWKLQLSPKTVYKDCVACYFHREEVDLGPDQYELDCELAFLSRNGSVLHSETNHVKAVRGYYGRALLMKRDKVYLHKRDLFVPNDTLTIRCRMWDRQNPISLPGRCFAETLIETKCRTFIGMIEKFSHTEAGCKRLVSIKSEATETLLSSLNLSVNCDGKLVIEIKPADSQTISMYQCKIFFRDVFGNKVISGKSEFYNTALQSITLAILKEYLMKNKEYYLPNDELTLECDVVFPTGKNIDKIDEPEYGFDCEDTQKSLDIVTISDSLKGRIENLTIMKDDLISVFREGILCDTTIKTATESFPAHTVILSARSPVFKSMFTTDIRENTSKCVNIDDLDADTVRRMLSFMYSATLDDLQDESAKSLFFAADKYDIVSLKHRCLDFLTQNLSLSNCCDILLLADKHQETNLKRALQDYIAENNEAVLISDEWKNLEKNQPQLAVEVFHFICKKLRENQA